MLLFHSPAGHWSCFHSSAVTNDAVAACGKVSVCAHVFISRGCELGAGLLGRVVTLVPVVAVLRLASPSHRQGVLTGGCVSIIASLVV